MQSPSNYHTDLVVLKRQEKEITEEEVGLIDLPGMIFFAVEEPPSVLPGPGNELEASSVVVTVTLPLLLIFYCCCSLTRTEINRGTYR